MGIALSAGLAAGGGAVADQAKGLIDAETRVNAEKELMAAREQMEMRLREAQEQSRRAGNAYDFEQAGKNQPEVLKREDTAGRAKGARDTELKLGADAALRHQNRAEDVTDAEHYLKNHQLSKADQQRAANKEPPGQKGLRDAQADYYRGGGAPGAKAKAGGGKADDEKTALALVDRYNRTAKALEDSGDIESARALRDNARQVMEGIGARQAGAGKGAAPKTYPPIPAGAEAKLLKNPALRGDFDAKYGPGAAALLLGD